MSDTYTGEDGRREFIATIAKLYELKKQTPVSIYFGLN